MILWLAGCLGPFPIATDVDADGVTIGMGDCDDGDAGVFPGALEVPLDGIDQDCDQSDACADLDCDQVGDVVFSLYGSDGDFGIESLLVMGFGAEGEANEGLPTLAAEGVVVADLDLDGDLDIVFANAHQDGGLPDVDSYAYYNEGGGPSAGSRVALPTMGAMDAATGDFDADGFIDVAFANHGDGETLRVPSVVYWGSATGLSATDATALPTIGASQVTAADLDFDGFAELIFANSEDDDGSAADSRVYWGAAAGFDPEEFTDLPTVGAAGSAVGDVDDDGYLDLVFSQTFDGADYATESLVYLGSPDGYLEAVRFPTLGATEALVADLDGDGLTDVVFANSNDGDSEFVSSLVYWGSEEALGSGPTTSLPTVGAAGVAAGDVNGDGFVDVGFANRGGDESVIYWGSADGLSAQSSTAIPTLAATDIVIAAP